MFAHLPQRLARVRLTACAGTILSDDPRTLDVERGSVRLAYGGLAIELER